MRSLSPGEPLIVRSYFGDWPTMLAVNSLEDRTWNSIVSVVFHGRMELQLEEPPASVKVMSP